MIRKLRLWIIPLFLGLFVGQGYCWNALGHRLVAQIAYHHLTPHAKYVLNRYNHALDNNYRPQNLVNAAVWLDSLRYRDDLWLGPKHYIDIPFSFDGTELMEVDKINAVSAIVSATELMKKGQLSYYEKGFTLRILLHVVGDIHQPLHAANQFSAKHPQGDKGGNLFPLSANSIGTNLHSYWDKGGGFLSTHKRYNSTQLSQKASRIEKRWPCSLDTMNLDPNVWAQESHQLAVHNAYQLKAGELPSKQYQQMVKATTQQRIAIAGCRLAALLNQIA